MGWRSGLVIVCVVGGVFLDQSWTRAAAVVKRQEMLKQRRRQIVDQQKQAVRQRQEEARRQAYQRQVLQQKVLRQKRIQQMRRQAIARQKAVLQKKVLREKARASQRQVVQRNILASRRTSSAPQKKDAPKEVVRLEDIWNALEFSSKVWTLMMDMEPKVATVDRYIQWYAMKGIKIENPPVFYARMIDEMAQQWPEILDLPFDKLLKVMAVMEYDFDNGRDKDLMARELLGERLFLQNKQRLSR